jgi:hypothetical protein
MFCLPGLPSRIKESLNTTYGSRALGARLPLVNAKRIANRDLKADSEMPPYLSIVNPSLRFSCQHSSVESEQNGFSLP